MKRGSNPKPELSPEIAAIERLTENGASSNAAVRKRIVLIAAERKLDPSETEALMKGRWLRTFHLCQFAKKHHLSVDWLISAGTVASQGHCLSGDGILRGARQMPPEAMRRNARVALVVSGQVGLASNQR